eukprot:TRINITY_DN5813_c0_g1_i1.p1 TRINITY_DN5813_c0_g1~~TRINITY_DN5813_c0_g1_i1.p1  ORF type:complete len:229 (+),score=63.28 TRINITY_DN5813_c0_g1_i1:99-785(+)
MNLKNSNNNPNHLFLYGSLISPNTWRVAILLKEKNIEYTLDLPPKGLKSKEHLQWNERGQIPILKDGDIIVNESLAQMLYLQNFYSESDSSSLLPNEKSLYGPIMARLLEINNLTSAYSPIMFKGLFGQGQVTREQITILLQELTRWEKYAQKSTWLATEEISLADIAAFPAIAGCVFVGISLEKRFPKLFEWYKRMSERPSIQNTWPFKETFSMPHSIPGLSSIESF